MTPPAHPIGRQRIVGVLPVQNERGVHKSQRILQAGQYTQQRIVYEIGGFMERQICGSFLPFQSHRGTCNDVVVQHKKRVRAGHKTVAAFRA